MVISVQDYNWRQTDCNIIIRIPLKGVPNSKVDVFTSEIYIKAFFNPFIFEVFLLHSINESASKCTITDDEIIFDLEKCGNQMWETLQNINLDKKEKMLIKQQIIEDTQKLLQSKQETKIKLKSELSRVAVRKQMALDSERLDTVKKFKDTIKSEVTNELEDWKQKKNQLNFDILDNEEQFTQSVKNNQSNFEILDDDKDNESIQTVKDNRLGLKNKENNVSHNNLQLKKDIQDESKDLPVPILLPRKSTTIDITFSERVFPTPSRESQNAEEQEWLKKQTEARKIAGWAPEDLRPEEIDPSFLKAKGDTFFKQKNYLGAVSAYGYGIKLSPKYSTLYVNRSAAHFVMGNFHKCIEDCSTALELLVPPVAANLESRAKCFARRGAALCKLGLPSKGVVELKAALQLIPDNERLKNDLSKAYLDAEKQNE